ncbi:MAG: helix-turn-helix transcriptional regulator [Lachnospiraceae bacterium]
MLDEHMKEMRNLFIGQLFHGRVLSNKSEEEYFELFQFKFVNDAFIVLKVDGEKEELFPFFQSDGIYLNQTLLICGCRLIEQGKYYYILDASQIAMEDFVAVLEEVQEFCQCNLILSALHKSREEITQAYSEVLGTDGYANLFESSHIAIYSDHLIKEDWHQRYADMEKKLVNSVSAREDLVSIEYFEELWEFLLKDGPIPVGELKFFIMGVFNTILTKNSSGVFRDIILNCSKKIRLISGNGTVHHIHDIACDTINNLCQVVIEKSPKEETLKKQVLEYIDEHYKELDLSVDLICRNMSKSVSSVMKAFECGKGVLYFLNQRRITEAKRIILELDGEIGINQVADIVGFSSPNTFIRVFKKYEGITPGKFCDMIKIIKS